MLALLGRDEWNAAQLAHLSDVMVDASICGLGQAAPNTVLAVLRFFRERLAAEGVRVVGEGTAP